MVQVCETCKDVFSCISDEEWIEYSKSFNHIMLWNSIVFKLKNFIQMVNFSKLIPKDQDWVSLVFQAQEGKIIQIEEPDQTNSFQNLLHQTIHQVFSQLLSEKEKKQFGEWLQLICDELYVKLMTEEDLMKLCPAILVKWHDGLVYQISFKPIRGTQAFDYIIASFIPQIQQRERQQVHEIMHLMQEIQQMKSEQIRNLLEYLPVLREKLAHFYEQQNPINELKKDLHNTLPQQIASLHHDLINAGMISIEELFERLDSLNQQLALELQKDVDFLIENVTSQIYLPQIVFEKLWHALAQLLKNALDHGIEPTAERQKVGKKATATVGINVTQDDHHLIIGFQDDGKGIDLESLIEKVNQQNQLSEEELLMLQHDQEVAMKLIFASGISTKNQISVISGRGMGMSIVKKEIESCSGKIQVDSKAGEFCKILLTLPIEKNHIIFNNEHV